MKHFALIIILLINHSLIAQKPLDYEKLYDFKNGYALVQNGNKIGFIDVNGNLIGAMDVSQNRYNNDGILYQGNSIYINQEPGTSKDGVRQYTGEYVMEPEYNINPLNSLYLINNNSINNFMKPKTYQVMDEDGKIIYSQTLKKPISDPLFPISKELVGIKNFENDNSNYAVKSIISDFQSEHIYKQFGSLNNGFIKAQRYSEQDGKLKWGFLNTKGEEVIDFVYSKWPSNFSDSLAIVENTNNLFGYIDTSNNIVLEPKYIEAYEFVNGKALVRIYNFKMEKGRKNDGFRLINTKGEILYDFGEFRVTKKYGEFNIIENGNLIRLKSGVKVGLFNTDTLILKETPYSSINRFDSNLALVYFTENRVRKSGYINEKGELVFYAEKKNQF